MTDDLSVDNDLNLNIDEPEDETKKGKGLNGLFKNKVVLAGILLVLILGGAGTAWFLMDTPQKTQEAPPEEKHPIQRDAGNQKVFFPGILTLGSFESPLGDMGGVRTLKITVELSVDSPAIAQEIQRRSFQIKSTVVSLMAHKTFSEIQGADGKILLKNELIAGLNRLFETGKIRNLYFSTFLIL
jgi:flagellar protein FliL